jgi:hypothetical protein
LWYLGCFLSVLQYTVEKVINVPTISMETF